MMNETKITGEYVDEGKGVLEIFRNPWKEESAMSLVGATIKEIQGLEKLRVVVNSYEWRQTMTITSYDYCPAIIPREHLDEVAKVDYVFQLVKW